MTWTAKSKVVLSTEIVEKCMEIGATSAAVYESGDVVEVYFENHTMPPLNIFGMAQGNWIVVADWDKRSNGVMFEWVK